MDLSKLSSNLPPSGPLNQTSVDELNKELTTEFRNAAKSVAALYNTAVSNDDTSKPQVEFANAAKSVATLYRLSNNSSSLLHQKGYLECLDDILEVMTNGEDVENWVLTKKAEINNSNTGLEPDHSDNANENGKINTEQIQKSSGIANEEFHIPSNYDFSFVLDLIPDHHFKPSFPPLSVTHSLKQMQNFKNMKKDLIARKKCQILTHDEVSNRIETTHDSGPTEKSNDGVDVFKKQDKEESVKKRRKYNPALKN
ncbi:uncharacterized protein PRCAT00001926001 [Priceomyces carsonii]|uniref:uncharacterized protein n=1 Tax=Priceomyces carsonii TaxID=28549 RepID=UPI002ED7FAC4|nr:unnamed protein product [Priceomyces carsonii]